MQNVASLVGAAGFELATPCSQSKCSTRLSYAPDGRVAVISGRFSSSKSENRNPSVTASAWRTNSFASTVRDETVSGRHRRIGMSASGSVADIERVASNVRFGHVWTAPGCQGIEHVSELESGHRSDGRNTLPQYIPKQQPRSKKDEALEGRDHALSDHREKDKVVDYVN